MIETSLRMEVKTTKCQIFPKAGSCQENKRGRKTASSVMCNCHMFMFIKHNLPHETVTFSAVLLIIQIQMVLEVCQAVTAFAFHFTSSKA